MSIETVHLEKSVAIAREFGAKRLWLFGSALQTPETARDLDLACEGVEGWDLFRMGRNLNRRLLFPLILSPFEKTTDYLNPWPEKERSSMNVEELRDEVSIELEAIRDILEELESLHDDLEGREPAKLEVAAAGLFLANFYNGIENIFKRLCRFYGDPVPAGENWHVELMRAFRQPLEAGLPVLLNQKLFDELAPYRRFRHVVHHGMALNYAGRK